CAAASRAAGPVWPGDSRTARLSAASRAAWRPAAGLESCCLDRVMRAPLTIADGWKAVPRGERHPGENRLETDRPPCPVGAGWLGGDPPPGGSTPRTGSGTARLSQVALSAITSNQAKKVATRMRWAIPVTDWSGVAMKATSNAGTRIAVTVL